MTGTTALEQYAHILQTGHRAKAQLKRSVQAHKAAIGRLSAAKLELQSAKQKASDELQAHFKQLQQQLLQRYKQTLILLEQEYDLRQLPITSTTQVLQSSIAALEETVDRLYLGLQQPSPAKSVQQYTATMQEVSSVMQKAQAAVQHSQDQSAASKQHTFESVRHFKQLRVTSKAVSSPAQTDSCCDVASISSLDTASFGIKPAHSMRTRPWGHAVLQSQLRSHNQDVSRLEGQLHLLQHPEDHQHMIEHSNCSSAQSGLRHHGFERHNVQQTANTAQQGRQQQQRRQQLALLPDSWHNAPPPKTQQRTGSVALGFSQHSNQLRQAVGPRAAVDGYNTLLCGRDNAIDDVWRHQRQHGQQHRQWSQQSELVQPPPETVQLGPAASVAAGGNDTASWMHSLPGSSVLAPAPAPHTPAPVDSVNMSNVGSRVAACSVAIDGAQYHTVNTVEAVTAVGAAVPTTDGEDSGESSEGQTHIAEQPSVQSSKEGVEEDVAHTWESWRHHTVTTLDTVTTFHASSQHPNSGRW